MIRFRSISTSVTVSGGSITLNEPDGIEVGDILLACIAYRSNAAFTAGSEWTKVAESNTGNATADSTNSVSSVVVFQTTYTGSAVSYDFTRSGGDVAIGSVMAMSTAKGRASRRVWSGSVVRTSSGTTASMNAGFIGPAAGIAVFVGSCARAGTMGTISAGSANLDGTPVKHLDTSTTTGADVGLGVATCATLASGNNFVPSITFSVSARHSAAFLLFGEYEGSLSASAGSVVASHATSITIDEPPGSALGDLMVTVFCGRPVPSYEEMTDKNDTSIGTGWTAERVRDVVDDHSYCRYVPDTDSDAETAGILIASRRRGASASSIVITRLTTSPGIGAMLRISSSDENIVPEIMAVDGRTVAPVSPPSVIPLAGYWESAPLQAKYGDLVVAAVAHARAGDAAAWHSVWEMRRQDGDWFGNELVDSAGTRCALSVAADITHTHVQRVPQVAVALPAGHATGLFLVREVSVITVASVGEPSAVASGDITLLAPAGVQDGDILVAFITGKNTGPYAAPSGWNVIASGNNGNTATDSTATASFIVAWTKRTASTSYTFTRSGSTNTSLGRVIALRSLKPGMFSIGYVDAAQKSASTAATSHTGPYLSGLKRGDFLLGAALMPRSTNSNYIRYGGGTASVNGPRGQYARADQMAEIADSATSLGSQSTLAVFSGSVVGGGNFAFEFGTQASCMPSSVLVAFRPMGDSAGSPLLKSFP